MHAGRAQDTTRHDTLHQNILRHDSLRQQAAGSDTARRRYIDTALFADNNILTGSDYLMRIQKIYQTLNKVPVVTGSFEKLDDIADGLTESDTALSVIKERLSVNDRTLNLRNLQMFYTLLEAIRDNNKKYSDQLDKYDEKLDALKKEILDLRRDTTLRQLFRDSTLRKSFVTQLKGLRAKWSNTDTLVRTATNVINKLKTHASANSITVTEMIYQTNGLLARIGPRAFTKERNYLWEPLPTRPKKYSNENFRLSGPHID